MIGRISFGLLAASFAPAWLAGQSLEQRVSAVDRGTVRLSFPAHSGVCGSGDNVNIRSATDEWEHDCGPQQVLVAVCLENHRVIGLRTYVDGRWRSGSQATDLGTVRPQEAAAYFIGLAERGKDLDGDPVFPAALADSVTIWPSLLKLARTPSVPLEMRRTAIFWLGQAAEAAAGLALDSMASDPKGDREVRKQAVFALSQREHNEGVPALIRVARSNPDPELRKSALFWLGQSDDPRALALFEEMLR